MPTILLNLLPFLKRWWKQLLLALFFALLVWYVWSSVLHYGQARYDAGYHKRDSEYKTALDAALQAQRKEYEAKVADLMRSNYEISASYQNELSVIRARAPGPDVWMCNNEAPSVPTAHEGGTGTASGSNGETGSQLPQAPRNIGPGLASITDDADETAVQLGKLQQWVLEQCVSPETAQRLRTTF